MASPVLTHPALTQSNLASLEPRTHPRSKAPSASRSRLQPSTTPTSHTGQHPAWNSPHAIALQSIQRHSREGGGSTPSLSSILAAYTSDGDGDTELLKALLFAKAREDERLTAFDMVRAEQMRAANLQAAHQQQAYWMAQQHAYAPYSPVSPQSSPNQPGPMYSQAAWSQQGQPGPPTIAVSTPGEDVDGSKKRSHAGMEDPAAKKHRGGKPSHDEVMVALRARCERNKAEARSSSTSRSRSSSSSSSSVVPPSAKRLVRLPTGLSPISTKAVSDERSNQSTGSRAYPSPPPRLRPLDPLPFPQPISIPTNLPYHPPQPVSLVPSRLRRSISEDATTTTPGLTGSTLSRLLNGNAVDVASSYARMSDVRSSVQDTDDNSTPRAVSV